MKLKMCSCRQCKYGRRRRWGNYVILHFRRKYRHKVKQMLKQGLWEEAPIYVPVPYTD